jgi:TolB-like protein
MFETFIAWVQENADLMGGLGTLCALTMFLFTNGRTMYERWSARKNGGALEGTSLPGLGFIDAAPPAPEYGGRTAVAVMPFREMGDLPEHFAEGLMDDLIADLQAARFATPAKRATEKLAADGMAPHEVARELGTSFVLEGSIRMQDNRYRITVQLLDRTSATLWSDRINMTGDDVMAIQEASARKIADAITALSKGESPDTVAEATRGSNAKSSKPSAYRTQSEALAARYSPKSRLVALVLAFFVGFFGVHRFYVGRWLTGILYILTMGLFGIGWLLDILFILFGAQTDSKGRFIRIWLPDAGPIATT